MSVFSALTVPTLSVVGACAISSSSSFLAHETIVVSSLDTVSGDSGFVCVLLHPDYHLVRWAADILC